MTMLGMDAGAALGAGIRDAAAIEESLVDKHLEAAIDALGREKVLGAMRSYGWKDGDAPPKWAWWCLVNDMRRAAASTADRTPAVSFHR